MYSLPVKKNLSYSATAVLCCSLFFSSYSTMLQANDYHHHSDRTCSKVTTLVFKACRHDSTDDFFIKKGKCLNSNDWQEIKTCMKEAKLERKESLQLCNEQRKARKEVCHDLGQGVYAPNLDPALFVSPQMAAANPNPYFPLTPGLVRILESEDETITVTVTDEVYEIMGIESVVVHDVVEEDGKLVEDTDDWYAQDIYGNVWYLGELSRNYEDGQLKDLDGSWQGGEDGAVPGIIMHAVPEEDRVYRQEYALAEAEDMAQTVSLQVFDESTPAADCSAGCLLNREYSPIEPGHEELKYYAPGIGNILVVDPETGSREELVEVIYP